MGRWKEGWTMRCIDGGIDEKKDDGWASRWMGRGMGEVWQINGWWVGYADGWMSIQEYGQRDK